MKTNRFSRFLVKISTVAFCAALVTIAAIELSISSDFAAQIGQATARVSLVPMAPSVNIPDMMGLVR